MSSARRVELALPITWLLAVARGSMTSYAPSVWKEEQAVSQSGDQEPGSARAKAQTFSFLQGCACQLPPLDPPPSPSFYQGPAGRVRWMSLLLEIEVWPSEHGRRSLNTSGASQRRPRL